APVTLAILIIEPSVETRRRAKGNTRHFTGCGHMMSFINLYPDAVAHDRVAVERAEDPLPRRLHQSEPRVHERPAVVACEEVAVDVARPRRQRQRDAEDAGLELDGLCER